MEIVFTAIILFGIITIMGLYLSSYLLRNKQTPNAVIIIRDLITITGFMLLITYYPASMKSILFFSVVAFCGLVLLYPKGSKKEFSKWLCFAHSFLTIAGFIFTYACLSTIKFMTKKLL